ncbi:MAG: pitrilysin family protein [Ignavibacteria bacterium]|jgi:zinc protease
MSLNRKIKPDKESDIRFHLPAVSKTTSTNGIEIYSIFKENLPIVTLNIIIDAGNKYDPKDKLGLAYLTSMLIDEGAGKYSALELDNEIELLGSSIKISVDHDSLNISVMSLTENIERTMELASLILTQPSFNEKDYNREINKLKHEILQSVNEPDYLASTIFEKIVFNNSSYSNPTLGYTNTVENISLNDIKDFYKEKFIPSNITLITVGNLQKDLIKNLADKCFKELKGNSSGNSEINITEDASNKIYVVNSDGSVQSEIRVGHLTNERTHKDYYSKRLVNSILGGQFTSRLNHNLREVKGFTYGVHSGFFYNLSKGNFEISTAVESKNTGESVFEILKEIDLIRQNITNDELEFVKSLMIKKFPLTFETYADIAKNITTQVLFSLPDDYFNNFINNIASVDLDSCLDAANKYLIPGNLKIVVVGNGEIIKKQLSSLFDMEIIELDKEGNPIN